MSWLPWVCGGGIGTALAIVGAWLWCRKLAADVTVLRERLDEERRTTGGLKAALQAEIAGRANDTAAHKDELADLHARKLDEQERMGAIVRGLKVEIERYRRLLRDHATPESVASRLDDLGGVLPSVPATADSAPSVGEPVPGLAAACANSVSDLK